MHTRESLGPGRYRVGREDHPAANLPIWWLEQNCFANWSIQASWILALSNAIEECTVLLLPVALQQSANRKGWIGHRLFTDWTQIWHRMVTEWSQNSDSLVTDWSQHVQEVTNWLQIGYKVVTKWLQSGHMVGNLCRWRHYSNGYILVTNWRHRFERVHIRGKVIVTMLSNRAYLILCRRDIKEANTTLFFSHKIF
jgi:hypothetical protein